MRCLAAIRVMLRWQMRILMLALAMLVSTAAVGQNWAIIYLANPAILMPTFLGSIRLSPCFRPEALR